MSHLGNYSLNMLDRWHEQTNNFLSRRMYCMSQASGKQKELNEYGGKKQQDYITQQQDGLFWLL